MQSVRAQTVSHCDEPLKGQLSGYLDVGGRTQNDPKIGVDYNEARFPFPRIERDVLLFLRGINAFIYILQLLNIRCPGKRGYSLSLIPNSRALRKQEYGNYGKVPSKY